MQEQATNKFKDPIILGIKIPYAIIDFLQSIVVAISVCIIIYLFIATPNQIDGQSMEPNYHNGEIILTNKISQWFGGNDTGKGLGLDYKRGDIVVFQKPGYNDFIKRIIAGPGDNVAIREGYVYINGKKLVEDYLPPATFTKGGSFIEDGGESKSIPENQYFVLGDNRNNSHDSRFSDISFISRDWMKGKVILKYWPLNEFGIVSAGTYKEI